MQSIITALREVIGNPNFYKQMEGMNGYTWDYGAIIEYFFAGMLTLIVVGSIFRILIRWGER